MFSKAHAPAIDWQREKISDRQSSIFCSHLVLRCGQANGRQALAAMAVTSTRMPSTASAETPTAARTGHGLEKNRW